MNPYDVKLMVPLNELTAEVFAAGIVALKRFSNAERDSMLAEYSDYLHCAEALPQVAHKDTVAQISTFWKLHYHTFPAISKFAMFAMTIITSSASAERAFSMLKNMFAPNQNKAHEDYVQAACMSIYNA